MVHLRPNHRTFYAPLPIHSPLVQFMSLWHLYVGRREVLICFELTKRGGERREREGAGGFIVQNDEEKMEHLDVVEDASCRYIRRLVAP